MSGKYGTFRIALTFIVLPPVMALGYTLRGSASLRLFLFLLCLWFVLAWAAVWIIQ